MPKPKHDKPDTRKGPTEVPADIQAFGTLVIAPDGVSRSRLTAGLDQVGLRHTCIERPTDLPSASGKSFDAVLIAAAGTPSGFEVAERVRAVFPHTSIILFSSRPTLQDATHALRVGVCDLISVSIPAEELRQRVEAAAERTRTLRARDRRLGHLQNLCKQLNTARQEVTQHVGSLCDDLVNAYQDLSDQIGSMSVSAEFASIIRQELDIEDLLRVVLEYMLGKLGAMNAGVFLPSTSGDFSLGAYINYDCDKDTAEALLDHLADVVAPRFEHETEIILIESDAELERYFDDEAHWLTDRSVVVFSCIHEGECLAVVTLFRDINKPFTPDLMPTLRTIADHFGQQLARVIRTHHRHLPHDQWGALGDPHNPLDPLDPHHPDDLFDIDDDDIDLAA